MTEKLTLITAIELWKRWFDWRGNPWIKCQDGFTPSCFFCGADKPSHEANCVYTTAKELVAMDNKGELG